MLSAPIGGPAEIFIWIVCITIGFTSAIIAIDNLPKKKKHKTEEHNS